MTSWRMSKPSMKLACREGYYLEYEKVAPRNAEWDGPTRIRPKFIKKNQS